MLRRTKRRIAYGAAALIACALIAGMGCLWWFGSRSMPDARDAPAIDVDLGMGDILELPDIDWEYWRSVNPDIVGWIHIPGTNVSSPIAHAPKSDSGRYLKHDIYGEWNPMGAIYLDADSEGLLEGGNSVILGHNWASVVFGTMANYSDRDWAAAHRAVAIMTPDDEVHLLRVEASDVMPGWTKAKRTTFEGRSDLDAYWQERFGESEMKLADEATPTDQLFTFVTCSYTKWKANERTVTYAVEVMELPIGR